MNIFKMKLFGLIILSVLCSARPQNEKSCLTAYDYYIQGIQLTNSENWYKAARSYESSINLDSTNQDAWYNLGIAYCELGMWTKSINTFKKATKLNPEFFEAHNNLGLAYYKLKEFKFAEKHFNKSLRINPAQAEAYRNLGILLLETEKFIEAIPALVTAISKYPNDSELYSGFGWALAVIAFQKSIDIRPKHVNTLYNLGLTYIELDQKDSAMEVYHRLKKLDKIIANSLDYLIQKIE